MDGPTQVPEAATLVRLNVRYPAESARPSMTTPARTPRPSTNSNPCLCLTPLRKRVWARLVSLNPDFPNLDLSDSEVIIGRQKNQCTYAIEYQYISQQHCKVPVDLSLSAL